MKHYLPLAVIAFVVSAGAACNERVMPTAPPEGSEMSRAIVEPYLKIQTALVDDNVEGVRANAGNIATAATALGAPAMKIDTAAVQLTSATGLEDAREKFGALSEAIEAYMKGFKLKPPDGVKAAFCPMLLKPWLQEGETIANPYYGRNDPMATCGDFR